MNKITLGNVDKLEFRTEEAFRTLRTNISFCGANIQTIAITSTVPNEGKSNVSLHLAISMAEAGYKVCFIDADMRKSVLVGRFRMGVVGEGLSNFLSGQENWEDCLCETDVENLHAVFAGPVPPNPTELLGSSIFSDKLAELKNEYDYIIIDTPPLGSVIDGAVVAAACDGSVLIIEANRISYRQIRKTKEQLEKSGCKILGTVLNKVDVKSGNYGKYYKKYYGYGEYYKKEDK